MDGYRRPPIVVGEFRDQEGEVIPYGRRWDNVPASDLPYSVTAHPERFAPIVDVARALAASLPEAHRTGGSGATAEFTVAIEITPFPGAMISVAGHDFVFPPCGCDACDEDVEQLAEDMELLVDAVVAGRFEATRYSFRYWGEWGSKGGSTNPIGRV